MNRLPPSPTERIDRGRKVRFTYLGRALEGYEGDTVASALWASGVRVFGRSLEYRRPRGLYNLEGESASTLMAIDGVPNVSADTAPLTPGMTVAAQNVRGNPESDRYAFLDRLDGLMPAGFYYRIFHRPYRLWPFFQDRMRGLTGLGVLDPGWPSDASRRFEIFLNAEVAVIGGGAAGMRAALAAAETNLRVCLFERRPWLGGHLDWRVREHEGRPLYARAAELAERVDAHERIRVFRNAPVTGVWGENLVTGFQVGSREDSYAERHFECRAHTLVVATGCIERPLVCNHNERPGVMQVDTAWRLARTYGVLPGQVAVFSVGDDLGLEAALDLAGLGVKIAAVADARPVGHDPELVDGLHAAGIEFLPGSAASAANGRNRVAGVEMGRLDGDATRRLRCDLLVAGAGRGPEVGALSCAKARFAYDTHTHTFQPTELPLRTFAAGSMRGLTDPGSIEASGHVAGLEASLACGRRVERALEEGQDRLTNLPGPVAGCGIVHGPNLGAGRKAFIDFDEDGTYKNAVQCAAQGFDVPELAKRFGNFGLGPGQYRIPGQNLAMAMAEIAGTPIEEARCTTVRPPLVPPFIATVAGPKHDIHKRTPLHDDQEARGALFRRAGIWQRARYFSDDLTCRDEIRNVRQNVGMLDSSPLGKFRIFGPDAMKALQRVYISDMTRVRAARCKYSAMCNDTGNIVDDGVVTRVGEDDYYLTTSSNRAGATVEWFRYHTRYDGWDYNLVNLTDTLASINVAGPNARLVVQKVTDADLSNDAFPYMGYREIVLRGRVEARCLRLGFVGELSYELHVPASYARYVWDLLWNAGREFGIRPFGQEAQYCLRAEKGHVIIGAESEQRVTLTDIGMGWLWDREDTASKKVGAPALRACVDQPGRMKLVGFRLDDPARSPQDGTIVVDGAEVVGFVCTTRDSEALGYRHGMALVRDEYAVENGTIELFEDLGTGETRCTATLTPPHFYDPQGDRLRV